MKKVHGKSLRIEVKNSITIDSLVTDLGKVFTDEIEAFGDEYKAMSSLETNIVLNSGECAIAPSDAQRLLFLADQYRKRAEALQDDIEEIFTKFFEEEILKEESEKLRLSRLAKFIGEEIADIYEIQKLLVYRAREKSFSDLAMLIINEYIGHDSTHAECINGIGIRKGWKIVKLYSEDNGIRSEFNRLIRDVMKDNKSITFEGLDDLIDE